MKVILAHGYGKLHFFTAAKAIKESGIAIKLISGWRPQKLPPVLVNFLGKIAGRDNLYKRLAARSVDNLDENDIIENAFPEFLHIFLLGFTKINLLPYDFVNLFAWRFLGYSYRKHLKNANIFHIRSGAGQGGAIKKAKKMGMVVIADHSIAHPQEIEDNLNFDYAQLNLKQPISVKNDFWKLVLQDCIDADYIVVNSDYVKQTFVNNGFDREKLKVVYWSVREDFAFIKKKYALNKTIQLLFTGGFNLRKGARIIVEAANILRSLNINFKINIVGAYEEEANLVLENLQSKSDIILHGSVLQDDLKGFLSESDIYIFPTFAEGCAQSAMEAMSAGMPVITTANCGLPMKHEVDGLIIPTNNTQALVDAILQLSKNEQLREYLGTNAAHLIKNNYTWDKYGVNMKNVYQQITEKLVNKRHV